MKTKTKTKTPGACTELSNIELANGVEVRVSCGRALARTEHRELLILRPDVGGSLLAHPLEPVRLKEVVHVLLVRRPARHLALIAVIDRRRRQVDERVHLLWRRLYLRSHSHSCVWVERTNSVVWIERTVQVKEFYVFDVWLLV